MSQLKEPCDKIRINIRDLGTCVKDLMKHEGMQGREASVDVGEMKANIMLAYRHLEDARMRLGKVIQAEDGGRSVYNNPAPAR